MKYIFPLKDPDMVFRIIESGCSISVLVFRWEKNSISQVFHSARIECLERFSLCVFHFPSVLVVSLILKYQKQPISDISA